MLVSECVYVSCMLYTYVQVMLAAIFDLLFSQCDRHGQNLYLQPDGSLVLIDNDQVTRTHRDAVRH